MTDIEYTRNRIDEIDTELVELFLERMNLSGEAAKWKSDKALPILDKARERDVLAKVAAQSGDMELYTNRLYSTIFEISRAYQRTLTGSFGQLSQMLREALLPAETVFPQTGNIACQGVEGAYSQQACDKLFPRGSVMYMRTFEGVFDAVESGLCKFGILPIENSSNGSVNSVYELMQKKRFYIIKSIKLCIRHELLVKEGTKLSDIREIYSHEQAIGQCSSFLKALSQEVRIIPCLNTAVAAQEVAEKADGTVAAISSGSCAELYGLVSLKINVQNSDNNYTRFICIAKEPAVYPGANKISLMLSSAHSPGGLYGLISKFNALGINLTKLESRPIVGSDFEFLFFFDLEASVCSPEVQLLLEELRQESSRFAFLGNYSEI